MGVHAVSAKSMELQPFDMVRMQCAYDGEVDYDLSGSGVPSVSLKEVMGSDDVARILLDIEQGYPPTNGSPELRSAIAAMYERASADHILVTNGASEANFMAAWRLFEKGDEVVIIVPNYPQTWNLAESWGMEVRPLPLKEELGWQFDPEDLKAVVTRRTKAVHVCNPNNPTGAIMASEQRKALIDAVKDSGAWLLADEVYVGAELGGSRTQSLWGHHEKPLITNGLCKAYGMPGLRIGWLVGTPETLREITCYHDYLTLTHSMLSDHIARKVLEPERRERILAKNQEVVRMSCRVFVDWNEAHGSALAHRSPEAGAMCFVRHPTGLNSSDISERLRKERSVLVVPGDQLGMDGYMRIGTALPKEYLMSGLDRIDDLMRTLRASDPERKIDFDCSR